MGQKCVAVAAAENPREPLASPTMSAGLEGEQVTSAVPVADLSIIDTALDGSAEDLKEAVKRVRPADIGRDLSRRSIDDARRIFDAMDDRHGAAMLRATHPAVGGPHARSRSCRPTTRSRS